MKNFKSNPSFFFFSVLILLQCTTVDKEPAFIPIAEGWAKNTINTVIFRRNSLVSHGNTQVAAFYGEDSHVYLAKRKHGKTEWQIEKTRYTGDVQDAHNSISIMIDGNGYLHMAWNHHGDTLNYCRSTASNSLELSDKMIMTGQLENNVTYPEFHRLIDGNLLFCYRDGASGNGNLVINHYDTRKKMWANLHKNLIDGEGKRNAYWQMAISPLGMVHLSWVWRETWDVATNHDICYAKSTDQGKTWQRSDGSRYELPITMKTAEYAARIPQGSELINQTSMAAGFGGAPYITNYWTPEGSDIPQVHLIYHDGAQWHTQQITRRKTPFSLSGGGTKRIPISRPLILWDNSQRLHMIYRDVELGSVVTMATCENLTENIWTFQNLTDFSVGQWEPTFDTIRWQTANELDLFVQKVGQGDGEMAEEVGGQMVGVLEVRN